ncbi:MAG: hypothetical protein OXC10_07815 [Rhodospirillaceae bacterium]|nr:hypothetical protein [Rhodospirillaceae bacterium]
MASFNEQLQRVWHAFVKERGYLPATAREACMWGVAQGMIAAPDYDPYDRLSEDMSRALRGEYATDRMGRRYRKNHAVRVTKGGVQYTMWAILGHSAREHMHKAFIQRREQIVGDCFQLATDVDVYNDFHNDQEPIQIPFDFRDDVEERKLWNDKTAA